MSSTEGALGVSKNTSGGSGIPYAADLASKFACSLSPLVIFFTENPLKEASILQTVSRYFQASDPLPCYFYQPDL
jgi:hypothetical protein